MKCIYLVNDLGAVSLMGAAGNDAGKVSCKNLKRLFGNQQRFVLMTDEYFRELMEKNDG